MKDYQDKTQASAFDKAKWAAKKKEERETVFSLIDETAVSLAKDPELFQKFLDVQSRFDRYSVSNALLIAAQRPDMTEAADAKSWNDKGVYVKYGQEMQFKLVDIIYENEEYFVSENKETEPDRSKYVRVYDDVIVKGSDLYDGKQLS